MKVSGQLLGFKTTYDTKQWLITACQGALTRHDVVIHHGATYYEMTQYTELWNAVDPIAERIRSLGYPAPGSYGQFGKLSSLADAPAAPAEPDPPVPLVPA